jgi:hypothetical protein
MSADKTSHTPDDPLDAELDKILRDDQKLCDKVMFLLSALRSLCLFISKHADGVINIPPSEAPNIWSRFHENMSAGTEAYKSLTYPIWGIIFVLYDFIRSKYMNVESIKPIIEAADKLRTHNTKRITNENMIESIQWYVAICSAHTHEVIRVAHGAFADRETWKVFSASLLQVETYVRKIVRPLPKA